MCTFAGHSLSTATALHRCAGSAGDEGEIGVLWRYHLVLERRFADIRFALSDCQQQSIEF